MAVHKRIPNMFYRNTEIAAHHHYRGFDQWYNLDLSPTEEQELYDYTLGTTSTFAGVIRFQSHAPARLWVFDVNNQTHCYRHTIVSHYKLCGVK